MNVASTSTPRWAVSTHTDGEVLTVGVTGEQVDLLLLGIPTGFTAAEIEGWLRDLAGVAVETSRTDVRQRAIPSLLHHTLTGLLFSHAELWSRAGIQDPCSAVFVDTPDGASFGWVGKADARVRIDGRDYSPQWVHVRDDEGREARAAMLPPGVRAEVTIEHRPGGRDAGQPSIVVEAQWGVPAVSDTVAPSDASPATTASPEAPAESAAVSHIAPDPQPDAPQGTMPALPDSLPTEQPSLLANAAHQEVESMSQSASPSFEPAVSEPPKAHPVARWLGRIMNWGKRDDDEPLMESLDPQATPGTGSPLHSARAMEPSGLEPLRGSAAASESEPRERPELPVSQYDLLLSSPEQDLSPDVATSGPEASEPAAAAWDPNASAPPIVHAPEIRESDAVFASPPPVAAAPAMPLPPPVPAPESVAGRAAIAPAGVEDILGRNRPRVVTTSPGATPEWAVPPPQSAPSQAHHIPEDVSQLPQLAGPLARPSIDAPLPVDHEPVGAHDEQFAIAELPAARRVALRQPTLDAPLATDDPHAALLELPWLEPRPERDRSVRVPGEPAARRAWPAPVEEVREKPRLTRPMIALGAALVVLFGAGWLVGSWQGNREGEPSMVERALRVVGLGAPRFQAVLETRPPGAWVSIDGREMQRRTPVTLELPPGQHQITFSMPDLGEHVVTVSGKKGETIPVDESLHGSLEVVASDAAVPINVTIDRKALGYAPVSVESIEPGLHEVMFSGPGMPAWAQTVQVGIRRTAQVVAHPMTSPATGVLQIQATLDDEQGSSPLSGAQVYIDGELKGSTPLSVEVARGPHSIRVQWHGETAPVQVIDLPGGNQRFAMFAFGLEMDQPILKPMGAPRAIDARQPTMVSATLQGMSPSVIREAWLHVRTSEGLWRRSAMSAVRAPKGLVLTTVFPASALEGQSQTRWYMSAVTLQGDEYFTDMQRMAITGSAPRRAAVADAEDEAP